MNRIVEKLTWGGKDYVLEWIPDDGSGLTQYLPVTQAYGVCITDDNLAVVVSEDEGGVWTLPGGSLEPGETAIEALVREVAEEADITIDDIRLLGLQKSTSGGKTIYQARFVCRVDEIKEQTIDPAKGKILVRKFVPILKLNEYLDWKKIGDEIVRLARRQIV